jgi:hypothetical protein
MTAEGPPLELLLRRLAGMPPDFLTAPAVGNTAAVVNDLLRMHGAPDVEGRIAELTVPQDANRLRLALVLSWLMADETMILLRRAPGEVLDAVLAGSAELGKFVQAQKAVENSERREEVVRTALEKLSLRPLGENESFARDRLTTLSTAERTRVLAASRQAEARARKIREALAKKAAEESADKSSRE